MKGSNSQQKHDRTDYALSSEEGGRWELRLFDKLKIEKGEVERMVTVIQSR